MGFLHLGKNWEPISRYFWSTKNSASAVGCHPSKAIILGTDSITAAQTSDEMAEQVMLEPRLPAVCYQWSRMHSLKHRRRDPPHGNYRTH